MPTPEAIAYTKDDEGKPSLFLATRHSNGFWDAPSLESVESGFDIVSLHRVPTPNGSFQHVYEVSAPDTPNEHSVWIGWEDFEAIIGQSRVVGVRTLDPASLANIINPHDTSGNRAPGITSQHWSVMVIKPDAKERGLESEIFDSLATMGIEVVASTDNRQMTVEDVHKLWPLAPGEVQQKHMLEWWNATIEYMCEGPSSFHLLRGKDVTARVFDYKQHLRRKHGCSKDEALPIEQRVRSIIHTSETTQELLQNATLKWTPKELIALARTSNEQY